MIVVKAGFVALGVAVPAWHLVTGHKAHLHLLKAAGLRQVSVPVSEHEARHRAQPGWHRALANGAWLAWLAFLAAVWLA